MMTEMLSVSAEAWLGVGFTWYKHTCIIIMSSLDEPSIVAVILFLHMYGQFVACFE